jgi:hypothetical protein
MAELKFRNLPTTEAKREMAADWDREFLQAYSSRRENDV